jgi:hypothetical protein
MGGVAPRVCGRGRGAHQALAEAAARQEACIACRHDLRDLFCVRAARRRSVQAKLSPSGHVAVEMLKGKMACGAAASCASTRRPGGQAAALELRRRCTFLCRWMMEQALRRARIPALLLLVVASTAATASDCPKLPACHGCGCRGGTGYRDSAHHCVGFLNLDRVCGPAPNHARCTCEAHPNAGLNLECALSKSTRKRHRAESETKACWMPRDTPS